MPHTPRRAAAEVVDFIKYLLNLSGPAVREERSVLWPLIKKQL